MSKGVAVVAALRIVFAPILRWFTWWRSWQSDRFGVVVVVPDNFAASFIVLMHLFLFPVFHITIYLLLALPLLPILFTAVIVINGERVRWCKCFLFIPYWTRTLPQDVKFSLFEAWGDPAPSCVAFESNSARTFGDSDYCIHFGATRSATALYAVIGDALKKLGWIEAHGEIKKPLA